MGTIRKDLERQLRFAGKVPAVRAVTVDQMGECQVSIGSCANNDLYGIRDRAPIRELFSQKVIIAVSAWLHLVKPSV